MMYVNEWKQRGVIYLWNYHNKPKNFPGWHLAADSDGANSFAQLLSAMDSESRDSKRTLKLNRPTEKILSVPGCKEEVLSLSRLVVFHESEKPDFEIGVSNGNSYIVVNSHWSKALRSGLSDVANQNGDYSIGEGNNRLWFWWVY